MKTIRRASILIIGILIGYGTAFWQSHDTGPTLPFGEQSPPGPAGAHRSGTGLNAAGAPARDAVVYVDFYNAQGRELKRAAGLLLGPAHTLITPISALKHAHRGSLTDSQGRQYPLKQVLGADLGQDLAAVATGVSAGPDFSPSAGDGALYLGRELAAVTPDGRVKGWVDSAALQRDDGRTYYKVRTSEALSTDNAALVDPQTGGLIGMTMTATATPLVYEAVDATAISALVDALPDDTPRSLAAFGRYYAEHTTQGRVDHLQSLARARQWNALIKEGQDLLNSRTANESQVRPLLEKAYQATVMSALDRGEMQRAADLLDQATGLLGDSASRLRLRAALAQGQGHVEQARRLLHAAMNMNPALADAISTQIRNLVQAAVVNNDQLTGQQKIRLLESEMTDNPDDALYHQLLGQLYYRRADYQQAVDQLTRAVTLDSQLQAGLGPLIDSARQKLATPGLTDAPLFGTDHNYIVDVRINGHDRPLRFMLDTGSSYTALSAATAQGLGISIPSNGPMTPLQTANGIIEAPVITLHSLNVNGAAVNNIDVTVVKSLGQYDGLLGLSFLKHFDFNINQSARMLTLKRR